jgi:hypothetical protein
MVTTIIRKGLDLYDSGPKEEFILTLQHTFQTKIFGSDLSPSHWKMRYEKETGTGNIKLEAIQVRNNAARACINSINQIIELALHGNVTMSTTLIEACSKYQQAMKLLTSHREL